MSFVLRSQDAEQPITLVPAQEPESAGYKIYVSLADVRDDTIALRYRNLGYVVINDTMRQDPTEPKPVLTDRALFKRVFANLTLGYFSGQAQGSPHVSRIDYNTELPSGMTLKHSIDEWCKTLGVSNDKRPSTSQLVDLISHLGIPLSYGSEVIGDIMDRVVSFIFRIRDSSIAAKPAKQAGKTTIVNNLIRHLVNTGEFETAIASLSNKSGNPRKSAVTVTKSGLHSPPTSVLRNSNGAHTITTPRANRPVISPLRSPPITPHASPIRVNLRETPSFSPRSLVGENAVFNVLSKNTAILNILEKENKHGSRDRTDLRNSLDAQQRRLDAHESNITQLATFLVRFKKNIAGPV